MIDIVAEIEIPQFNEYVVISMKRKAKYNKQGKLINPRSAGTPRLWKVNGNDLYSGNMHYQTRKKAASWMHQYLRPFITPMRKLRPRKNMSIGLYLTIYDVVGKENWDVSNKWPWIKWFEDTLTELGKWPDDSIKYVRDSGRVIFVPVDNLEQRKLIFTIFYYEKEQHGTV